MADTPSLSATPSVPIPTSHTPAPAPTAKPAHSFAEVLKAVGEEARRGERMMEQASAVRYRRDLSAAELLALQAGVYRYSEVVDLATKLVDRVAQTAKTIVQSGGQ